MCDSTGTLSYCTCCCLAISCRNCPLSLTLQVDLGVRQGCDEVLPPLLVLFVRQRNNTAASQSVGVCVVLSVCVRGVGRYAGKHPLCCCCKWVLAALQMMSVAWCTHPLIKPPTRMNRFLVTTPVAPLRASACVLRVSSCWVLSSVVVEVCQRQCGGGVRELAASQLFRALEACPALHTVVLLIVAVEKPTNQQQQQTQHSHLRLHRHDRGVLEGLKLHAMLLQQPNDVLLGHAHAGSGCCVEREADSGERRQQQRRRADQAVKVECFCVFSWSSSWLQVCVCVCVWWGEVWQMPATKKKQNRSRTADQQLPFICSHCY